MITARESAEEEGLLALSQETHVKLLQGFGMFPEVGFPGFSAMTKKLFPPVLFLLLTVLPALCADTTTTSSNVIEEVVARVNNDIVTRSELQHSREEMRQELRQQYGDKADSMFA